MSSSEMGRRVAFVRRGIFEKSILYIIRVQGIIELGTTLGISRNRPFPLFAWKVSASQEQRQQ
jgi:hypothetical protein